MKKLLDLLLTLALALPAFPQAQPKPSRPVFLRELLKSKVVIVPAGEKPRVVDGVILAYTTIQLANVESGNRGVRRQSEPFVAELEKVE
jgi:hypothetical protein